MSDLVPVTANDVAVSLRTGEVFNLTVPAEAARALREFREIRDQLRDVIAAAEHHLVDHAQTIGTKTLHVEGVGKVTVTGGPGSAIQWDLETLELLRAHGLPDERWNELVTMTVSWSVNTAVAGQIERSGNPKYAEIVGMARKRADRPWRASVK